MLIVTTTERRIGRLGGQAEPGVRSGGAPGVSGLRSSIAALADENWGVVRRRRHTLVRASPMQVYGAGVSGAAGLLLRAVRHEALLVRMEVRDLRRLAVVAVG